MRLRSRVSVGLALAVTGLATAAIVMPRVGPTGDAAAAVSATQATAASIVPYTPPPSATGTDLYVDNITGCYGSGNGSDSQPFCTIAAAASAAQPGQTVVVEPGDYSGNVTISDQGTAQDPITFDAIENAAVDGTSSAPAITISGAHNVVLNGFIASGERLEQAFYVTGGSSGITINGGAAEDIGSTVPAVEVDGTSSDVTVSRMTIEGWSPVQVDPGASGVAISGNTIEPVLAGYSGVLVTGAPGTDVTGNTISSICAGGISIAGASTGVTVENNIVQPQTPDTTDPCAPGTAISVSAASEANSVVDYNLIDPTAGESLYNWGGTSYTSLADFQATTGQGAHDIAANPELGTQQTKPWMMEEGWDSVFWFPPDADSPAIDSADANAPGELPTDQLGNPRTDDPGVANTGTGVGYYDRGAVELEGDTTTGQGPVATNSGLLSVTWSLGFAPGWTSNGPSFSLAEVNFGDGTPQVITQGGTIQHTYAHAGLYTVQTTLSGRDASEGWTTEVVVGAGYTPITPDRILDTRYGTGTGKVAPVAANGTLTLPIPTVDGVSAADMSAVVMNVTVTSPAKSGNLTVYPGSGAEPSVSNLNFSAGETVPNLVTVQVSDGEVSFHNNSSGSVEVLADLEGFYGPGGYGYQPGTPTRVLNTRDGTGASGPVAALGVVRLNLAGKVPAGTAAVVMNLTVTQPSKSGHLTVYPDGVPAPNASNVNFSAGETVPNLVIVPVTNGVADIANRSSGTVQLVADLEGYFSASAPDAFVPISPTRWLDTRVSHDPLGKDEATSMGIDTLPDTLTNAPPPVAAVENVTVTQPAKAGNLIVYPYGQSRPVASNLNFSANETVPNLAIVKAGSDGWISYYNDSAGQLQLIVDEYGYYMNAG